MLETSPAIVLKSIRFKEKSHIIQAYTQHNGRLSLLLHGSKAKSRKFQPALLQPLTLVEIVYNLKSNRDIQTIRDIKCNHPFRSIPFDIKKSSIALFIAEILTKCLKEEDQNEPMYEFLHNSLLSLDKNEQDTSTFQLLFLFHLSRYLGFFPQNNYSVLNKFFHLEKGFFVDKHISSYCLNEDYSNHLHQWFKLSTHETHLLKLNRNSKQAMLESLLKYYSIHLFDMQHIKTLSVLKEVFK